RVLAIGSKNGSFFLLNAETMEVLARRQLLPMDRDGQPFDTIDFPDPVPDQPAQSPNDLHENSWGVFQTAAVHGSLGRIFVGLGGHGRHIDFQTTPFMRALDWDTLEDAWVT